MKDYKQGLIITDQNWAYSCLSCSHTLQNPFKAVEGSSAFSHDAFFRVCLSTGNLVLFQLSENEGVWASASVRSPPAALVQIISRHVCQAGSDHRRAVWKGAWGEKKILCFLWPALRKPYIQNMCQWVSRGLCQAQGNQSVLICYK